MTCFVCLNCSLRLHVCLIIFNKDICSLLASVINCGAAVDGSTAPVGPFCWNISGMSEVRFAGMMNEGLTLGLESLTFGKRGL